MVGHKRKPHRIHGEEAEGRNECPTEKEHRGDRAAADSASGEHQRRDADDDTDGKEPLPERSRVELPARIDEREFGGPEQLPRVEPRRPAGDQKTFGKRKGPFTARRADPGFLHPGGVQSQNDCHREEREEWAHVRPRNTTDLPPDDQEQSSGECRRDRLAQHGGDEERERGHVPAQ